MTLQGLVNQAYPSPEWVVFFEVSNSTGFGASRRADAVALGVWPSRGHSLIGFEFKEHRGDWLNEKKNPAKAEAVSAHCDGWYVVAGSKDVVKVEELPEPWGLYVANEDRTKLRCVKTCVPFEGRDKAIIKRHFAASMLRKVGETTVPKVELNRIVEERVKQAVESSSSGRELKFIQQRVDQLEAVIEKFQTESGVDIRSWRGASVIGKAVAAVLDADSSRRQLEHAAKSLERSARDVRDALEQWPIPSIVESA